MTCPWDNHTLKYKKYRNSWKLTSNYSRIKIYLILIKASLILEKRLNIPFNFSIVWPFHLFLRAPFQAQVKNNNIYNDNNVIKNIKCPIVLSFEQNVLDNWTTIWYSACLKGKRIRKFFCYSGLPLQLADEWSQMHASQLWQSSVSCHCYVHASSWSSPDAPQ